MADDKRSKGDELGDAAAGVFNAGVKLLELLSPEDARRARAAVQACGKAFTDAVPGGALKAYKDGDVVEAALLTILEQRRRRRGGA